VERREQASASAGRWRASRRRARGTAQSAAGAAGARHMAGVAAAGRRAEKQRRRGLEVDEWDLFVISRKCRDSTIKTR
jgi:hypothetical protein